MNPMLRVGRLVPDDPLVSIIVLVLDDVRMVGGCLDSLRRTVDSSWRAELVVVANGTSLGRLQDLQRHEDIVLVRSETNLGFAGGNNLGAGVARAERLVFLNDDSVVEPEWLDQLARTAADDPTIGAVGSRILFDDGTLQEAGAVIWGDGPTTAVGRDLPPGSPEYCYLRDVDYVSANGLLVRRDAWEEVGGFAEDYHPAYYEDVDLCLALQQSGHRVVYEPRAVLRHMEGGSSSHRYRMFLMGRQREVFRRKWAAALVGRERYPTGDRTAAIERALHRIRGHPRQVLVLDDGLPDGGIGSGFARAALAIEELVAAGFAVTLRPFDPALGDHRHTSARTGVLDRLADLGVDVRYEHIGPLLRRSGTAFDVVLCSRPRSYHELRPHLGRLRSQVPVVYDTEALWYRGLEREARLTHDRERAAALMAQADEVRATERAAMVEADHVVAVSREEAAIVAGVRTSAGVDPGAVSVMGGDSERSAAGPAGWEDRRDVVFPAGWLAGAGSPNLTSLRYFAEDILPRVVEAVPWIRVLVTGGNPPDEALALAGPNLQFLGYVPDMRALLDTARAVVVPMRTGAGRKLKTLEAMLAGVPTVSTTVGAEGVDLGETGGLVVTDDPADFARTVVALHEDPAAWRAERGRLEAFCAGHDVRPRSRWSDLLGNVIHDARLRAVPETYRGWLRATQPRPEELSALAEGSRRFPYRPTVSICVPVYEPKLRWLEEAVASVRAQTYDRWQLCLVDDGCSDPAVADLLRRLGDEEPRVSTARRAENGGISRATNDALALSTGEFVAFLDQDDLLAPQALHRVVAELQDHPATDLFYCDEDLFSPERRRCQPYLKPRWSPETLLSFNYITHFVVARRSLVDAVGGLRPHLDGSQDHDLVLRLGERTDAVRHLDDVLYTWRQSATSTSLSSSAKPGAHDATVAAVTEAMARRGVPASVVRGHFGGGVVVRWEPPPGTGSVTVILTASRATDRMDDAAAALDRLALPGVDVVVAVTGDDGPGSVRLEGPGRRVVTLPGRATRAELLAAAAAASEAEFLVTLDAGVAPDGAGWLGRLRSSFLSPDVAVVGARIVAAEDRSWHEGVAVGPFGAARITTTVDDFSHVRLDPLLASLRNVSAVSGLCSMVRREVWDKVGGWDADVEDAVADVHFCLRAVKAGYRNVITPEVIARLVGPVVEPGDLEPEGPDAYWSPRLAPGGDGWGLTVGPGGRAQGPAPGPGPSA